MGIFESFTWGPEFVTGIADVDHQHQGLVELVNQFGAALAENSLNRDVLVNTFQELADYSRYHFDTEEKYMVAMELDSRHIDRHRDQHCQFVCHITDFFNRFDAADLEEYRPLFDYLLHWLVYHILGMDQNMARQVGAITKGATSLAAYNREERSDNAATEPLLAALHGLFDLVSRRNRALQELNLSLEKRVGQRTRELLEANKALELISVTDHLTQLPNRRFALRQLQLLLEETLVTKKPLACLMVDADGFKTINDTQGHDAGDLVLQRLATELKDSVRSDDLVCRLGGDEFIIVCPATSLQGALLLAEETRKRVNAMRVAAGDGFWQGSISIGVASTDEGLQEVDPLIKAADQAVYLAKKEGRNCVRSRLRLFS
ncbi:GGDEF domain-containing protein [Desulfogranum mediterraneum]|uniref:GGDEF domain-containing protein n=1 Tax=Desulfogranum mediterraneum TaxID=160661 RepID=UPI00048F171D|nr:bacteriohemerythrin [Desulfogranum mediterraneum]